MMAVLETLENEFARFVSELPADPRPFYAELRERAPVFRTPFGFWYVTRYDLAQAVIRNDAAWSVSSVASSSAGAPHHGSFAFDVMHEMMLTLDGEDHARLRRLVSPIFVPRAAEKLRETIQASVDEQLDALAGAREIDLVEVAYLLPTRVILDVLGIGHEEAERFVAVADSLIAMHEPTATEETIRRADEVFRDAAGLVLELAAERRRSHTDDLLGALVEAGTDAERLSEKELVSMVLLLVVAGHETTANTLCTGLYHLLQRPDALQDLRADPSILPTAVEELLRYDPATRNTVARYAVDEIELGDQLIPRGDKLFVGLQAANHDPAEFERPLELDLRRSPNRHIGFSAGAHYCLGAALARIELQLALNGLLARWPTIELAGEVRWKPSFIIRGLETLPLRLA
jgi:cytochrome P450